MGEEIQKEDSEESSNKLIFSKDGLQEACGPSGSLSDLKRSNLLFETQNEAVIGMSKTWSNDKEYPKLVEDNSASLRDDVMDKEFEVDYERDSEMSSSTLKNSIQDLRVSRNHLILNLFLRILMLIVYAGNVWFMPWLRNKDWMDSSDKTWNYNPSWLFYDGNLYMYFQLLNYNFCFKTAGFNDNFWTTVIELFVAGLITNFVAFLVFVFEILAILSILNIIYDHRITWFRVSFFQRYNFVFIIITIVIWFLWQQGWSSIVGLSYGFYSIIGIVVWWILLKFYYRYYKSKLYQKRVMNQLYDTS